MTPWSYLFLGLLLAVLAVGRWWVTNMGNALENGMAYLSYVFGPGVYRKPQYSKHWPTVVLACAAVGCLGWAARGFLL